MPEPEVKQKKSIKTPRYYHCFKISDSEYVLFDVKLDMPLVQGSLSLIKGVKLPDGAVVWSYHAPNGVFVKTAARTMEIDGDAKFIKPPLRFKKVDPIAIVYHHFKLSPVLSVLFDTFDMPIIYGDNQKVQATINKIGKEKTIFYYKEDGSFKNSFKMWMTYEGKKS